MMHVIYRYGWNNEIGATLWELIVHLIINLEVRCVVISPCILQMMHLKLPLGLLEDILNWQELGQCAIPNDLEMI